MKREFDNKEDYDEFLKKYIDDDIQLIELIENTSIIDDKYIIEI